MSDHISLAREYIAKGEEFYARAADEIIAALAADPTLGYGRVGSGIGKSEKWCRSLVQWRTNPEAATASPFARVEGENERKDAEAARRTARTAPDIAAEAIKQAPPEQRKQIVESLMQEPEIRVQAAAASEEATASIREKARAQDHAQRDRLAWMNIETEFDKVSRALKNALLLVRECDIDAEARELLTERAHELRASLEVLTMALAGASTVDWDAELAKLETKGNA